MKTRQSTGSFQQWYIRLLLCFIYTVVFVGSAFAFTSPNSINQCYDCHGSPIIPGGTDIRPVDSAYRNVTTGGFVGNHRTHISVATSNPLTCTPCHGPAPVKIDHRNGIINMRQHINSSATTRGTYSKGVFFNQTSAPLLGNCTNVNCHFQKTTLNWGSPPYSFTDQNVNDCDLCHGNGVLSAPQDGSHPGNASNKHGVYYGTGTNSCVKCHSDHTVEANKFAHATSAGNRALILQGSELAPTNYSLNPGNLAYPTYMTNAAASRNGTCTNLYCHSDGTKAVASFTSTATPTWGVNSLTCASCHGYKIGSASVLVTGSHTAHINSAVAGRTGENFSCDQCHKATTSDGATISNLANHVNKAINVNMTSTSVGLYSTNNHAPGGAVGTCANTTCHNSGRAGVGTPLTVTWGTAAGANKCAICHGTGNIVGSPDYASGAAGSATANSHNTHAITKGINCSVCHIQTTITGTTIIAGGGKHLDGSNQDVAFGAFNGQGAAGSYAAVSKTCSSTYCHSSGTPVWGGARLNCRGCHGGDAAHSSPIATGKHTAHTNPALNTSLGLGNGFQCAACHAKTITTFANNTTISNPANHINGLIDYSGIRAGGSARYSTVTKQCSTIYCHSNGNPSAIVYVNPAVWNSGTTYGCNGCHGTSNPTTGAPDYVNGGPAPSTTANSHLKHVTGTGMVDTKGCANCHAKTVSQTTASAFKDYTAANYHLNGTPNLSFKNIGGKTGTWSGSTCSTTYCHGVAPSAPWGQLASLACNACHAANNALPGAHAIHYASAALPSKFTTMSGNVSTVGVYRFSCGACHSSAKGAQHAGGPANATGAGEVFYGFTSATMKGAAYVYGTLQGNDNGFNWSNGSANCNTTYCHSNGQGANGLITVNWSTAASSGTCVQCHDTKQTGATATKLSGKHDAHMNTTTNASFGLGNGLNCNDCHAKTVKTSNNSVVDDKTKHVNKMVDYSSTHGGGSAKYSSVTKTCTNIYCHSNGNPNAIVYANPAAWNLATTYSCNGCHGTSNPTTGAPDYANGGNGTATANSHAKHVAGAVDTTICSNCHVKTASMTTGGRFKDYTAANYHLNTTPNVVFNTAKAGATAAWTQATAVCGNVTCHGGNNATWGATLNCQDCHSSGAAASVADFGATFWNNGTLSKFQMTGTGSWAVNGHGLAAGNYGSGNPAANFGGTNPCEFCHDAAVGHKLATNGFRLKNYSTASFGRNAPCLICHSATGGGVVSPAVKNRTTSAVVEADHFGAKHGVGNSGGQFCWDCHDPHGNGTSNLYMIKTNPAKVSDRTTGAPTTQAATAVVFTAKATGTDFANGTTFNGICNVCHTTANHYTASAGDGHNSASACTACHNHTGTIHGSDAFKPAGDCNICHDYDTVGSTYAAGTWTGGTWGKAGTNFGQYPTTSEGWGAHDKHINHIKTRLGITIALSPLIQTFGIAVPGQVCGTCHTNTAANHNTGGFTTDKTGRLINFGDSAFKIGGAGGTFSMLFGPNPVYNGISGTSSSVTPKTCSNLSCHYFISPVWSTY